MLSLNENALQITITLIRHSKSLYFLTEKRHRLAFDNFHYNVTAQLLAHG